MKFWIAGRSDAMRTVAWGFSAVLAILVGARIFYSNQKEVLPQVETLPGHSSPSRHTNKSSAPSPPHKSATTPSSALEADQLSAVISSGTDANGHLSPEAEQLLILKSGGMPLQTLNSDLSLTPAAIKYFDIIEADIHRFEKSIKNFFDKASAIARRRIKANPNGTPNSFVLPSFNTALSPDLAELETSLSPLLRSNAQDFMPKLGLHNYFANLGKFDATFDFEDVDGIMYVKLKETDPFTGKLRKGGSTTYEKFLLQYGKILDIAPMNPEAK